MDGREHHRLPARLVLGLVERVVGVLEQLARSSNNPLPNSAKPQDEVTSAVTSSSS
jgi:hypothetical protein